MLLLIGTTNGRVIVPAVHGAVQAFTFADAGLPSTVGEDVVAAARGCMAAAGAGMDVLVVEFGEALDADDQVDAAVAQREAPAITGARVDPRLGADVVTDHQDLTRLCIAEETRTPSVRGIEDQDAAPNGPSRQREVCRQVEHAGCGS